MKNRKTLKRILMGSVGFLLAVVMFMSSTLQGFKEVVAGQQRVFDQITSKYGASGSTLKILEVIPDDTMTKYPAGSPLGPPTGYSGGKFTYSDQMHKNAEMGYFLWRGSKWDANNGGSWQNDNSHPLLKNPSMSTWGTTHNQGDPSNSISDAGYPEMMYRMYQYGLIKQEGQDGEQAFPIYALNADGTPSAVYESYAANGYAAYDATKALVKGVYSMGAGEYNIANVEEGRTDDNGYSFTFKGYSIDDNGNIYYSEIYDVTNVSENSVISDNTTRPDSLKDGATRTDADGNSYVIDSDAGVYPTTPDTDGKMTFRFKLVPQLSNWKIPSMLTYIAKNSTEGAVKFTRTETATTDKTQYLGYSDRGLFYNTSNLSFLSSDQFREYVLGDTEKYHDKVVMYETISADKLTPAKIDEADLIYISGTSAAFKQKDITTEAMIDLYNKEVNEHKAIMMDYAAYSTALDTNVSRLALLLWQESSQSTIQENHSDLFDIDQDQGTGTLKNRTGSLYDFGANGDDVMNDLKKSMIQADGKGNGNFVVGNVYVYNHHMSDYSVPKSLVDAGDNFANGDFSSAYTSEIATAGFQEVLNYITATNKVTSSTEGNMKNSVSPAVAIQYILISTGNGLTVMKQELRVLEIQPVYSFLYNKDSGSEEYGYCTSQYKTARKAFINNYLSDFYQGKQDYIQFVSKTVDEFNGSNEDLIENYDIIFIGSEMGDLYFTNTKSLNDADETFASRKWDDGAAANGSEFKKGYSISETKKVKLPIYRAEKNATGDWGISPIDYKMTGNVYYTQGDYFKSSEGRMKKYTDVGNNNGANMPNLDGASKFSARDITKNKLTKLKEYLDADNLIICEKDLMCQVYEGKKQINPTCMNTADTAPETIANSILAKRENQRVPEDCGRIDNSSNMYELFKYALGYEFCTDTTNNAGYGKYIQITDPAGGSAATYEKENFISAGDLLTGRTSKTVAEKYVATEKLSLVMNKIPKEYGYDTYETSADGHFKGAIKPDSIQYLDKDADNNRELLYDFVITSNSTVVDTYRPFLFIDINNDGKFSKETEMITDAQVFVKASGEEAERDSTGSYYVLYKDVEYELKRPVDKDYYGYIKWKLYLQSLSDTKVHASSEGSTVAENLGDKVDLKILQLTRNSASNLELQAELERTNGTGDDRTFMRYLSEIPGYNLFIKTITVSDFETDFNTKYNAAKAGNANLTPELYSEQYFEDYEFTRTINGSPLTKKGCNMLVLGFGDNYDNFSDNANGRNAIAAVRRFIENGNPTLMTHDFIMFDSAYQQVWQLRDLVGMDKYGVSQQISDDGVTYNTAVVGTADPNLHSYLHSGKIYTRSTDAADKKIFNAIEKSGRQPAYNPGTLRGEIGRYTQGFTDPCLFRYKWANWNVNANNQTGHYWHTWLDTTKVYSSADNTDDGPAASQYNVDKLNSGQITDYPYVIPSSYKVSTTHNQYFELNMDADDDNDGESDVVVWYTLGESNSGSYNMYGKGQDYKHASNAYYIYNKGNITYTGAGHSDLRKTTDAEAQLFVNTLFAALQSKLVKPSAGFYETSSITASPVSSVAVPYDGNVTKRPGVVDSSILKDNDGDYRYKFVDPNADASQIANGTKMYFRMADANFVRGTKSMEARLYLAVPGMKVGDTFTLPNGTTRTVVSVNVNSEVMPCIEATDLIKVYNVNGGNFTTQIGLMDRTVTDSAGVSSTFKVLSGLKSQVSYGFYLPMSYLNNKANFSIILESCSMITSQSAITGEESGRVQTDSGFDALTVTKAELLDLD